MAALMNRIGRERGWAPIERDAFEAARGLQGATFIGSPSQVIDKILYQCELFDHRRFLIQFIVGSMPHAKVMRSIELLGTVVAPAVREAIARRDAPPATA